MRAESCSRMLVWETGRGQGALLVSDFYKPNGVLRRSRHHKSQPPHHPGLDSRNKVPKEGQRRFLL